MTWIEIFYPSNSKMKDNLARLSGQLDTLLESCFTAVNHLIDCIGQYLPGKQFEKIHVQTWRSLQDNCNLIIKRINEINEYMEKKARDFERLIGTDLFQQLMSLDLTFQENILIAKKILKTAGLLAVPVNGAILLLISKGIILTRVVATLGKIATCTVASFALHGFGVAVDMIISAILGAVEKNKLEIALKEYTEVVEEFKPAAQKFYDDISMIRIKLEVMNDQ